VEHVKGKKETSFKKKENNNNYPQKNQY